MLETKKGLTEEEMIMLDEEGIFIPITYDKMFKAIFKEDLGLLKLFILSQLELDIDPSDCKIELMDSEIIKLNKVEYQKTVDLYVKINDIYVNVEVNREYFRTVKKRNLMYADRLYSMILEQGEEIDGLENKIFVQINLNAVDKLDVRKEKLKYGTDKLVTYGLNSKETYNDNKFVLIKYLEYYRDLYYNKREKLRESDLWMVLFTSKTFQELYNVSKKILDHEKHYCFMRKVIDMAGNRKYFEDWELEKWNEYVEYVKEKNAIQDGLEEGMKQGMEKGMKEGIEAGIKEGIKEGKKEGIEETTQEYIKKMLNENLSIDLITKITNKTEKEILEIKKHCE